MKKRFVLFIFREKLRIFRRRALAYESKSVDVPHYNAIRKKQAERKRNVKKAASPSLVLDMWYNIAFHKYSIMAKRFLNGWFLSAYAFVSFVRRMNAGASPFEGLCEWKSPNLLRCIVEMISFRCFVYFSWRIVRRMVRKSIEWFRKDGSRSWLWLNGAFYWYPFIDAILLTIDKNSLLNCFFNNTDDYILIDTIKCI